MNLFNGRVMRMAFIMGVMAGASACARVDAGTETSPPPVSTGSGIDELKASPCACLEIPMNIPKA